MFHEIRQIIQGDRRLLWLLIAGLAIQVITSITAIGTSSADQHFQIIEFSLYQLGKPSGATYVWEIDHFVRPTLQVYLFSGYHLVLNKIGLTDPYQQLTILRVLLGMIMYVVFNLMAFFYFKNGPRNILLFVLLLLNFSWTLPYTRTLYASEMMSSLFFFGTLLLYESRKDHAPRAGWLIMIGFLLGLSFYFRFQIASAIAGLGLSMLLQKRFAHLLPIAIGFVIAVLINVYLDYGFYKEWVFTPYTYFYANINAGRADSFGTSSFLRYIGLLILTAPAPLFSIVFLYYGIKTFFGKWRDALFLSTMLFIVAHSLVGHKEERFLFPILNVMPLVIGFSIPGLQQFYAQTKQWIRSFFKGLLWFTIVLDVILLLLLAFIPYSQTIQFSNLVKKEFDGRPGDLYCLGQTPFQSPSGNPMVFYKNGAPNIMLKRFNNIDSVGELKGQVYLATTFNEIKDRRQLFDSLGYRPVLYSSNLLWGVNELLHSKKINTINEIWVLYKRE